MTNEELMFEALEISKNALPHCRPNPPVGCVITYQRQIIASGFTEAPGARHAEIVAIDNCPREISACELFVTLEPCCFFGRTPACTDALIKHRPLKIYVGMLDSDHRNNGQGIAKLKAANLDVEIGILEAEVSKFLFPFLSQNK